MSLKVSFRVFNSDKEREGWASLGISNSGLRQMQQLSGGFSK